MAPEKGVAVWETRKSARAGVRCSLRLEIHEDMREAVQLAAGSVAADLIDISTSGAGMEAGAFLPRGTLVRTQWPISMLAVEGEEAPAGDMHVCARVAYARGGPDRFRTGLVFEDLPAEHRQKIDRLVRSQERRRFPRAPLRRKGG